MAKVITDTQQVIARSWWQSGETAFLGILIGVCWWVLYMLLNTYTPMIPDIAGTVSHVLVAVLGVSGLVRLFAARPLLIAIASATTLWGLGGFVDGLVWYETLLWSALLFGLAYALFGAVAHIRSLWVSLAVAVTIVVVANILLLI
ncbi:hypothetical protein GW930_01645 [Candidatus Saccharibacteria bacterium]|nr:hypothetical protein [Candidatus Saccharibacteria bacterium]